MCSQSYIIYIYKCIYKCIYYIQAENVSRPYVYLAVGCLVGCGLMALSAQIENIVQSGKLTFVKEVNL